MHIKTNTSAHPSTSKLLPTPSIQHLEIIRKYYHPNVPSAIIDESNFLSAVVGEAKAAPSSHYYDHLARTYEGAFSHDIGLRVFIERTLLELPNNSKVLDIGCGTGKPVSYTMAAHGHNVHGLDLSGAMVDLSMKCNNTPDFDVIFTIFSLFCLSREEMTTMASKMFSWLKPNGLLCIGTICAEDFRTTPSMYDADGLCATGVEMMFMGSKCSSMTAFTKQGWKGLIEAAGFEIIHTKSDLFTPRPSAGIASDDEMHYYIMARKI
ncbi:putative 2-heptaprenyl naphthoquinone protein [Botrytis fragariae]|uniref:phosphoethanolamine N-methyltransferase n=1 Tax=Botrytis fragariae TaxID=1964551 RepID=A0A8H6EKU4_9HELO|nr:putative 2-heptaprenyl naphthoquinone protein [Botrytis fragariae]KAF5875580.1 putative 2-heptaprenyl naphthoquinone protein [Botrytis fragariae]